jgi:hypothetical protein
VAQTVAHGSAVQPGEREAEPPKYQLICSWCFCSGNSKTRGVVDQARFFKALGLRVKGLRKKRGHSQEDMISFGFSARHWQQIEAGRPITMTTLLQICDVFKIKLEVVVRGLDRGVYHD